MPTNAKKSDELDYSRPLDIHKDSPSGQVDKLVVKVEAELRRKAGLTGQTPKNRKNLKCLLINLYAHWKIDPELYTGVSFNKSRYKANSRYNALGISSRLIDITKAAHEVGYIELHPGFNNKEAPELSRQTRIRAKKKLTKEFEQLDSANHIEITRPENEEIIILRGYDPETNKKPNIEYKDNNVPDHIPEIRKKLERINDALNTHRIILDTVSEEGKRAYQAALSNNRIPDLTRKKLKRIFNNESWEQGGRFYIAWWAHAPKNLRPHIFIEHGGELVPTIEIDFSGIHIDLLYAREGINYQREVNNDPYVIAAMKGDAEIRKFCKIALNITLNADSRDAAIKAINNKLNKFESVKRRVKELGGAGVVIDLFTNSHEPIKNHFYSGIGNKLQFEDSQIAERILIRALDAGFIVLPIHDSFVCPWTKAADFYQIMTKAYRDHMILNDLCTPDKPEPFPRVKIVKSRYELLIRDAVKLAEMVNIETERYDEWIQELADDAGDDYEDWDDEDDEDWIALVESNL